MFDRMPQFGKITKAPIGNNLICVVPLTILSNDGSIWPKTNSSTLTRLKSELTNVSVDHFGFNQFDLKLKIKGASRINCDFHLFTRDIDLG